MRQALVLLHITKVKKSGLLVVTSLVLMVGRVTKVPSILKIALFDVKVSKKRNLLLKQGYCIGCKVPFDGPVVPRNW
jgi:hypothetical protein